MRWVCTLLLLLALPVTVFGDPTPTTWGYVTADTLDITIDAAEDEMVITVETAVRLIKMVNCDYLYEFSRHSQLGELIRNQICCTDSIREANIERNGLDFSYISRLLYDDSLDVRVRSVFRYADGNIPAGLAFASTWDEYTNEEMDLPWPRWEMFFWRAQQVRIHSNINVSSPNFTDENDQPIIGRELSFSNFRSASYLFNFEGSEGIIDTVENVQVYSVTAEVRQNFPDLILTEDVDIHYGHYNRSRTLGLDAEIVFNPEIVYNYAPMWLWFPNDDPNSQVELQGLFRDRWAIDGVFTVDTLEVVASPDTDPPGFFIHLPYVRDPAYQSRYEWYWIDPTLHVCCADTFDGELNTVRFIMPTAPQRPSRITITVTHARGLYRCSSPFDSCTISEQRHAGYYTRFSFFGYCREPGIVQAWWDQPNGVPATEVVEMPTEPRLYPAFPNPFNAETHIGFDLPESSHAKLTVWDSLGRLLATLTDKEYPAGQNDIVWNAGDVPAGVYLVKLTAGEKTAMSKVVLVK